MRDIHEELNIIESKVREIERAERERKSLFLYFIGLCFFAALLSAFALTALGAVDLKIVNKIDLTYFVQAAICFILLEINACAMCAVVFKPPGKRLFIAVLCYAPLIAAAFAIKNQAVAGVALPLIFAAAANLYFRLPWKKFLFRLACWALIIGGYTLTSNYIKLNAWGIDLAGVNILAKLIFSVDLFWVYVIYYKAVRLANVSLVEILFPRRKGVRAAVRSGEGDVIIGAERLKELNGPRKALFWAMAMGYQLFQLMVVLSIGTINDMPVELIIMLVVFWFGRAILRKCWHGETLTACSVATFSGFYILTKITLPLSLSLYASIVLSAAFTYLMYFLAAKQEEYAAMKAALKPRPFSVKTASEGEIRERCRALGKSKEYEDFCVMAFAWKMRRKQLAAEMGYSESAVRRYVTRFRRELEGENGDF